MKQLNNKQQKLVEDNHNLIYLFMNKAHLSFNAVEDWYGVCAEGLCKAAMAYNPDKNIKFCTLACICMKNEMIRVLEKQSKEEMCLSLDYYTTEDGQLKDYIANNYDEIGESDFYSIFDKNYNQLTRRKKQIIDACINTDGNFLDVAKTLGITKQRVSQVYTGFLNNIYSDLYGSEAE